MKKKLGFKARDPLGEIRPGILRRIPVSMSQMVGWRPRWQTGVIWGPFGFRAWLAHPVCGGRAAASGRRAVAPTLTPQVCTHPHKIAIPLLGGDNGPE